MTLVATSNSITIENSSGTPKFNSSNKLLYRKNRFDSNIITLNRSTPMQVFSLPGATFDTNTFAIVNVEIIGCNGSFGSSYVGSVVDLSSPILLHFEYATTSVRILGQEILSGVIQRNTGPSDLQFLVSYLDTQNAYANTTGNTQSSSDISGYTAPPSRSVSIKYQIQFFGWK